MSMLWWSVEPRVVGRQTGSLAGTRCVSTQRRPPTSSIHGALLPGLAVYIAGVAKGWAVGEQKKQNNISNRIKADGTVRNQIDLI